MPPGKPCKTLGGINYILELSILDKLCLRRGRVPDELWNEVCDIVQEAGIKTIPKEKKCKKGEMVV